MRTTITQMTALAIRIYDALCGKFNERETQKVMGRYTPRRDGEEMGEETERVITQFDHHFSKPDHWGITLERPLLEALILIPEDDNQVTQLQRVYCGGAAVYGFYTPQYTEEGLNAIFQAFAKKMSEAKDIYEFRLLGIILKTILPQEVSRLLKYQEEIAQGMKNLQWTIGTDHRGQEECLGDTISRFEKIGFKGTDNIDLLKAIWEKAKTSPTGYIDQYTWAFIARCVLTVAPELATCCRFVTRSLPNCSLGVCLGCFPTNPPAINPRDRRQDCVPSTDDQKIVIDLVEKAING